MIVVRREVALPPEAVWAQVSAVNRWAELLPTVDRVTVRSGRADLAVGARYALKQPRLPELVYEVTAFDPDRSFAWVARAPGVRTVAQHEVETTRQGCALTLQLWWEGPLAPVVRRLYGRLTTSYVRQEADAFTTPEAAGS